jgi:uncharacterized protein YutE (UPF0331/DUF86 family)
MDERILEHLKLLNQYLLYLRELAQIDEDTFVNDFKIRGSAERFLQLAIESCINVGNRILSITQFNKPVSTPETYGDIFLELAKLSAIPQDFVPTMLQMVKFRNRLVHIYWDIDTKQLYEILKKGLDDIEKFKDIIIIYLKQREI